MANQRTTGFLARLRNALYQVGKKFKTVHSLVSIVTATQVNGDTVELAGPFNFDTRVHRIITPVAYAGLTGATGAKLGFMYKDTTGVLKVIKTGSDALLWNGVSLAAAQTAGTDLLNTLNTGLDQTANIGDLLALTNESEPAGGVYLVLTFVNKATANGKIDWDIVAEEATMK